MSVATEEESMTFGESAWDLTKVVGAALLIAVIIRSLLFQPFNIPSGSMMGTLLIGDYLFVSKFTYGYSRYSLPLGFIPFSGRIMGDEPERGDVVVFKLPSDNSTDYIKRVIGLPGDRIQMRGGVLHINDTAVDRNRVEDFPYELPSGDIRYVPQYRETLPNGVEYNTLDSIPSGPVDNTGIYVVPEGHLFMMGDNRDNSSDSRVPTGVGFVPMENVVGRAELKFFSTDGTAGLLEFWRWPSATRWGRLLDGVD